MSHIPILIGFIILLCGGVSISQISILYRKHPLPFIKLFIRFLVLFNLYFFLQTVLEYYYLNIQPSTSPELFFWINSITDLFFSATLLFISGLAVRLVYKLGKQSLPKWMVVTFAILSVLLISVNIRLLITHDPAQDFKPFFLIMVAYVVVFHLAVILSLLWVYFRAAPGLPPIKRRLFKRITCLVLVIKGLSLLCLGLFFLKILPFNLSFYAVFFIYNLLPIIGLKRVVETLFAEELGRGEVEISPSLDSRCQEFGISKREQEIIALVLAGCSNRDIEDKLFISLATVKDHIYKIYKKTGVKNRVQLVNQFRRKSLSD